MLGRESKQVKKEMFKSNDNEDIIKKGKKTPFIAAGLFKRQ